MSYALVLAFSELNQTKRNVQFELLTCVLFFPRPTGMTKTSSQGLAQTMAIQNACMVALHVWRLQERFACAQVKNLVAASPKGGMARCRTTRTQGDPLARHEKMLAFR